MVVRRERLQTTEINYGHLVENVNSIILRIDAEGKITFINKFAQKFFGFTTEEIVGQDAVGTIIPETDKIGRNLDKMIKAIFEHPEQYAWNENENVCKNGERVWIAWSNQAILDRTGNVREILCVGNDITKRKRAEEALKEAEVKFRSIFENAVEGIFQTSPEGRYISANPALARMYGYESPEALLIHLTDIQHQLYVDSNRRTEFKDLIKQHGSISDFESQIYRKDGSKIWISENARVVQNENGAVAYYEGTVSDITQRKEAEQEILKRNAELAAFNRVAMALTSATDLKEGFRDVAHEVITLFNADCGAITLLSPNRQVLTVVANCLKNEALSPEGSLISLAENSIFRKVIETGQSCIETNVQVKLSAKESLEVTHTIEPQCLLLVPLITRGQVIGTLGVHLEEICRQFTPEEIRLGETIAGQIAGAAENFRLLEETQSALFERQQAEEGLLQALEKTETLYQISETLATATGQQQTFEKVLSDYLRLLKLKRGMITIRAQAARDKQLLILHRDGRFTEPENLEVIDETLFQRIAGNPKPLIIKDANKHPLTDHLEKIARLLQTDHLLILPIVLRSQTIGLMAIGGEHGNHAFSQSDIEIGQVVADQLAIWLENHHLLEEAQFRSNRLQTAAEVSRAASSILDVDDLIVTSVNLIRDQFDFYYVGLFLVDAANEWAVLKAGTGEAGRIQLDQNHRLKVGSESMIGWSIYHRKARIALDVGKDAVRFKNPILPDTRSEMALPLVNRDEVIGALTVQSVEQGAFSDEDITVLQSMTDQLANALANARLFESVARAQIENHRLLEVTKKERDRAALLYELGQKLNNPTTIEEVQEIILSFTARLGAIHGEIYTTDSELFVSVATTIESRKSIPVTKLADTAFSKGPEGLALSKAQKIVRSQKSSQDEWVLNDLPGLSELKAFVCIPYFSQRSTLHGALTFFHTAPDGFKDDHLSTFESVAIQAAGALENVWLLDQTSEILHETEMLYEATRRFSRAQDIEDLLSIMVDNLAETGIDFMGIALISEFTEDRSPEALKLSAAWARQNTRIDTSPVVLKPNQCVFINRMRYDFHLVVHYSELDPVTQATVNTHLNGIHTILAIPLAVGQNWLGVLLLGNRADEFIFKLHTITQVSTLAGQAAVVIQNLQLVEETHQNLFNSEILSNLGQELLKADTSSAIYELAVSAIAATEPDRGVSIFRFVEVRDRVDIELVSVWDNPRQDWSTIPTGSRLSTKDLGLVPLLRTGATLVSEDTVEDTRFSPILQQMLAMMQIKVVVAVPLWLNHQVEGFILVGNERATIFTSDQIRLYEEIARETSRALENRQLFDEAQNRARQLQTAAEVSQAATAYLDLDTLLFKAVELIKERFNFYQVSIFLVDEYQRYAVIQASTGEIGQKIVAMRHKLEVGGQSVVGSATRSGKACVAQNTGKDQFYFNNAFLSDTCSEVALPLTVQDRVIGVLDVHSTRPSAFDDSDTTVLQSMANQLANAIEATRAVQEANQALQEVSRIHQYYLHDQWGTYLKEKKSVAGFRLTDEGIIEGTAAVNSRVGYELSQKRPFIVPATTQSSLTTADDEPDSTRTEADSATTSELAATRVVAPLVLDGQTVIGAVDFDVADETVDEDVLKIVEAVAGQAAQAIESARLFEQMQTSREEAEGLYEVGRILVTTEDEQQMFTTVLGKMLSTLGLQQGGILMFEEDRKSGTVHALYENGEPVENPNLRFPVKDNPSYQRLIETKQPVIIEDVATDPLVASVREINLARGIVSLLLIPIIINDEVVGSMGADSVGTKHIFTDREVDLAVAMAGQLSITLQNRRLIEETKRRAVLLQTSADVGRVATSILDQEAMLDQAVELIRSRFGFYHVQVFLIDETEKYAVLHKSMGDAGQKLMKLNHRVSIGSQTVIGQVTHRRKPIVVRSIDEDNKLSYQDELLPKTESILAVPLQVGKNLIGVLDVQSSSPTAFSEEDISTISTMELLAAQLAIAIQNARAFKEQQETAERLKEIDKLKTQFLANMSHELRTPLNSIIGFSRVILKGIDGPLTELQKTDLTSIHQSGQHLLGLINNILDLSKIEAGRMELNFEEIEIEPIIKTVMSTAIALVKDKRVTLKQETPDDLPPIYADPTRLRQVILNLVSNACKFTQEGVVTTRVRVDGDRVIFSVTDTGIGIPEEDFSSVFEEFTQVDASTTRKVGGTGLGLPISRHFVEMHGGEIWVDSVLGEGSTFSFFIPIEPPDKATAEENPTSAEEVASSPKQRQVLAIESNPDVFALYKRFLEKHNYQVISVDHSQDIIPQIKRHSPTAILHDVILPGKDGWSLLKELKENPFTKDTPIIICTISTDKNRGYSLGAANYLIKPIVEEDLLEALEQIESNQTDEVKVLIVDDKADDVLLIRRMLEAHTDYNISEAINGKEGLELIKRNKPDLIILDLNMPEMDGFAMMEELRANEATRTIPIIIVSAEELTPEGQERLTGQVKVLLHKGLFTEHELLKDINQALEPSIQEEVTVVGV